jgi:hypothetical protein
VEVIWVMSNNGSPQFFVWRFLMSSKNHTDEAELTRLAASAVASLLFGILGLISFCFPLSAFAIALASHAINRIDNPANHLRGRGFAQKGRVIGCVVGPIVVAVGLVPLILGPLFGDGRFVARKVQNEAQLRAIHQQLVTFSQWNKGWYPGLASADLVDSGGQISSRYGAFEPLVSQDYIAGHLLVSPQENDPTINGSALQGISTSFGSYAVLEYATGTSPSRAPTFLGKLVWRASLNHTAFLLCDREIATGTKAPRSIWTSTNGGWSGSVLFEGGSVRLLLSDKGFDDQYGSRKGSAGTGTINNLFDLVGGNGRMTSD